MKRQDAGTFGFETTMDFVQTGDIAGFSNRIWWNLFGHGIRLLTGPFTHVGFLAWECARAWSNQCILTAVGQPCSNCRFNDDPKKLFLYHAAKGWLFHQSFIRQQFEEDKTLVRIVRLRYARLFDTSKIQENIHIAHRRAVLLAEKLTPYDWLMIRNQALRFTILRPFNITHHRPYFSHDDDRAECSEAVSGHIWNPSWLSGLRYEGLSLFAADPEQLAIWDTPTEVMKSGNALKWEKRNGLWREEREWMR